MHSLPSDVLSQHVLCRPRESLHRHSQPNLHIMHGHTLLQASSTTRAILRNPMPSGLSAGWTVGLGFTSLPPGWPLELAPGAALAKTLQVSALPALPHPLLKGTAIGSVGTKSPTLWQCWLRHLKGSVARLHLVDGDGQFDGVPAFINLMVLMLSSPWKQVF